MPDEEKRTLHTSVLVGSPALSRRDRRARQHAATQRLTADAAERKAAQRDQARAERAEAKQTRYLAASGEPGLAALRTPHRFKLGSRPPGHVRHLAGRVPVSRRGRARQRRGVHRTRPVQRRQLRLRRLRALPARHHHRPNMVIAGIVGAGKSALIKSLYTRSIAFGRKVYLAGDPKGEHSHIAEAVGGKAIRLGHGRTARLNPLDEGYRPAKVSDEEWANMIAARRRDLLGALAETVLDRRLSPLEHTSIDLALQHTVRENSCLILPMVVDRILNPHADDLHDLTADDGRLVGHALRRLVAGDLSGLFDGPHRRLRTSLPTISLDLSEVAGELIPDLGAHDLRQCLDGIGSAGP